MKRREFLKIAAAFPLMPYDLRSESVQDFGYIPIFKPVNLPTFEEQFPRVADGKGGVSLLHPYLQRILCVQSLKAHFQKGPDCVSQATGLSNDTCAAIQVILRNQRWNGKIATEWIHFGGRCVVGGANNINGGTRIIYDCKFIQEYGVLFRKSYPTIDFTNYKFERAALGSLDKWPGLVKQAAKHKMGKLTRIRNWEEARAALKNLCPVVFGSSYGFDGAKRDKDGFGEPSGTWRHAWMFMGYDERFQRRGALLMNSHGDIIFKGPKRHNQPKGSLWIDTELADKMLKVYPDAYALSEYVGTNPIRLY